MSTYFFRIALSCHGVLKVNLYSVHVTNILKVPIMGDCSWDQTFMQTVLDEYQ